jgi:hypothetical protein
LHRRCLGFEDGFRFSDDSGFDSRVSRSFAERWFDWG